MLRHALDTVKDESGDWSGAIPPLWRGVQCLLERAPSLEGLRAHKLHLLAAEHLPRVGLSVPREMKFEQLRAVAQMRATTKMLALAQAAYSDGQLLILKGPELAARYPDPSLRPSVDVDLLADEPERAQQALIAAGFEPIGPFPDGYYDGLHHLRPLALPNSGAACIEIHRRPNWVNWSMPPDRPDLFSVAVPALSQPGMLALPADLHVVVLVAHMWGEIPLRRVLDLIDLAVLASESNQDEITHLANRFALGRAWSTSIAAADALFLQGPRPLPLRTWARDLDVPRDRTVFETHLRRWAGPWSAHPAGRALMMSLTAMVEDITPVPGETWANKLFRVRQAVTHPGRSHQEHQRVLGPSGVQPRHERH